MLKRFHCLSLNQQFSLLHTGTALFVSVIAVFTYHYFANAANLMLHIGLWVMLATIACYS